MIFIFISITVLYIAFMVYLLYGYNKIPVLKSTLENHKTCFSIIVPFRNEAEALPHLLTSISELKYSDNLFEIIFVDDTSEDDSVKIIHQYLKQMSINNYQLIDNERTSSSPKKDAITSAINNAKYDWIITTDADCILPKYWLKSFDDFIRANNPKMVVAPVNYSIKNRFVEHFQLIDFWSLQTATTAGFGINKPFLNNGANLAYQKKMFLKLKGFEGNNSIASGDDQFIMETFLEKDSNSVKYLKSEDSIVITKAQPNWKQLFYQRVRWASKASSSKNTFSKVVGLIVLLMNASIIVGLTLVIIQDINFYFFISIFSIKCLVDYHIINKSSEFFNEKLNTKHFILSSIVYPFFSVLVVAYSLFFKYKWKGRAFKK